MPDPIFADPRLAEIYDGLDADRRDLDAYVAIADEVDARSVLDVGCGTGVFACLLARKRLDVVAVDPAAASLAVARRKPGADRVRWLLGDATNLPAIRVDLATMTGNVAQVFVGDDPARRAWESWNPDASYSTVDIPDVGAVDSWVEVTRIVAGFVSFTWTYRFQRSGDIVTSDSTLRFREQAEIEASLAAAGFHLLDVRAAADRPGHELVFVAERT